MRKLLQRRHQRALERRLQNDLEIWRQQAHANSIGFDERLNPYQANRNEKKEEGRSKKNVTEGIHRALEAASTVSARYR